MALHHGNRRLKVKHLLNKNTAIIVLLMLCVFALGNYVQLRAQVPGPVTQGFWIFRRPPVPAEIRLGTRKYLQNYIYRLDQLLVVAVDDPYMVDFAGRPVVWDQVQIDEVVAEKARIQAMLDDIAE